MGMDQYLLIPFLGGWTSIYQLFWCSPGVQGFDILPYGDQYQRKYHRFGRCFMQSAAAQSVHPSRPWLCTWYCPTAGTAGDFLPPFQSRFAPSSQRMCHGLSVPCDKLARFWIGVPRKMVIERWMGTFHLDRMKSIITTSMHVTGIMLVRVTIPKWRFPKMDCP